MGASETKMPDVDDVDAGWEDADEGDLDAGWDEAEEAEEPPEGLTPEEREARVARAAARKERLRAKAAEKAERRKARVAAAAAKQKKSMPKARAAAPSRRASERPAPRPREPEAEEEAHEAAVPGAGEPAPLVARRPVGPRFEWRRVVPFVVVLAVAVGVALYLWKR
ncbi:MAG TPA: hypothetical protein VGL81_25895 [Polyangiaceae bacterium]